MEVFDNNNGDFNNLFPDGDFSSIMNENYFGSGAQSEDNSINQSTSPLTVDAPTDEFNLNTNWDSLSIFDDFFPSDSVSLEGDFINQSTLPSAPNAPVDEYDPTIDWNLPSIFDDAPFSGGAQLKPNLTNQSPSPVVLNATDEYDAKTNGDNSLELIHFVLDAQNDHITILDEEALFGDSTVNDNAPIINFPPPKQACGNEGEIMYQMCPTVLAINGFMSVKQQPKANKRFRYQCDGARFLPDSRYHPLAVELPNLRSISLESNQKLGVVMTISTDTNNPYNQTFVHANDIAYRVDGSIKIGYGCVFIPLEDLDIKNCEKKFQRLSILYKKCDEYTFDLTPFDTVTMFGPTEKYLGKKAGNVGNAAKGKDFKKDFNLLSYKIVFQLAVKQDNVVYISGIACETDTIDELSEKPTTQSVKRPASVCIENFTKAEESNSDLPTSSPSKKFKSLTIGLPVTYASSHDVDLNTGLA